MSEPHRAIEPLGILHGRAAGEALAAGLALPLQGPGRAFTLARLHEQGAPGLIRPATEIPSRFASVLERVTNPPSLSGLPAGALLMAILNATPDSFSDPGRHLDPARAIASGLRFVDEGAALLDVGGESTRPGAEPPGVDEELARTIPIVEGLAASGATVSIDTRRAAVMHAALRAGAAIVNDVSGLRHDPDAGAVLAAETCPVVLMHSRGTPATMRALAAYRDVAFEVVVELAERIVHAESCGIDRSRIIVDPGIGFAKTVPQNLELLARLPILASLGCRVLLGVSRKSFIGRVAGIDDPLARRPGSVVAARAADAFAGAIHRVHDVSAARQALRVAGAIADG